MEHKPYGPYEAYIKRPLDFCLSLCALVVLSPVMAVTAILVRTKLGSPVLFVQERPGKNEKIFKLYKFRSMTEEKDEQGNLLSDEIRLTRFGRLLRASSLDELPELINILKGDMAVVGPRPLATVYLPYYTDTEKQRHSVRPGLTGLAQANGRNSISWEQKFEYDIDYVNHISFLKDCKIIFDTFLKVIKRADIGQAEKAPGSLHVIRANWLDENGRMKDKYNY